MLNLRNALAVSALGAGIFLSFGAPELNAQTKAWIEGSYEYLNLPETEFLNQYDISAPGTLTLHQTFESSDGEFDGFRFDTGVTGIPILGGTRDAGIKGFFAWYDSDDQSITCNNGGGLGTTVCTPIPLFDPDPANNNFPTSSTFDTQQYTTSRDVNYWGVALEVASDGPLGLKAGPAFRRIDQDFTVTGAGISDIIGTLDPFRLTYTEDLVTDYWGGFVGSVLQTSIGRGWSMSYDGEVGLYWANTRFDGNYVVVNSIPTPAANLNQRLSLQSDDLAVISSLKLNLEKSFDNWNFAVFGRGEFISAAPKMHYNDNEDGANTVRGPDAGTRIGDDSAFTFSAGVRLTRKFGPDNDYEPETGSYKPASVEVATNPKLMSKNARIAELEQQIVEKQMELKRLKQSN